MYLTLTPTDFSINSIYFLATIYTNLCYLLPLTKWKFRIRPTSLYVGIIALVVHRPFPEIFDEEEWEEDGSARAQLSLAKRWDF